MPGDPKTAKAVRKKYNFLSTLYDWIWPHYIRKTIAKSLNAVPLNGNEKILDIGCGTGPLEVALLHRHPGVNILGIDLSREMLERAQQKLKNHPKVRLIEGDFVTTELGEQNFDVAFCLSNLHYFPKPQAIFEKTERLLKNGGTLVVIDWNRRSLKGKIYDWYMNLCDPGFVKAYRPDEVRSLLKAAGFHVEKTSFFYVFPSWSMMCLVAKKV